MTKIAGLGRIASSIFFVCLFVSHSWSMGLNVLLNRLSISTYCNVAILLMPVVTKDLPISPRYAQFQYIVHNT